MSIVEEFRTALNEFPNSAPAQQRLILQEIARWKDIPESTAASVILEALPGEVADNFSPVIQMALLRLSQTWRKQKPIPLPQDVRERLVDLHAAWKNSPPARDAILTVLACSAAPKELAAFAELAASAPPHSHDGAAVAFAPLFQSMAYDPSPLFPKLFETLASPFAATAALDLSNFVTRHEMVDQHPATPRVEPLAKLLGDISLRLDRLHENPQAESDDPDEVASTIAESVGLAVALCDALALIGDESVTPKLYQAFEVRHRRLRTEAAAALARLGDEKGAAELVQLAAEPVARLRVIAYCEELGLADQLAGEYLTDVARAEAELAVALAQPTYYGIPPSKFELLHQREMHWPGYDEPVDCFLFEFAYTVKTPSGESQAFRNIGIAGPMAHAILSADLTQLSPDDIYALFAGWCAEHEDIFEVDLHEIDNQIDVDRLSRKIRDADFDAVVPVALHSFFNEKVLIANAVADGAAGVVAMGSDDHVWLPRAEVASPPGPVEAYHVFKGRRLLRSFNE